MNERFVTRGFVGRRDEDVDGADGPMSVDERRRRTPPGQYLTTDFPVLSAGPTPRTPLDGWLLAIEGLVANPVTWTWEEFLALPSREWVVDISCVTKMTASDGRCAHCHTVSVVGTLRAYVRGPGIVLRCPACAEVVIRIVQTPRGTLVDARGAAYLELRGT